MVVVIAADAAAVVVVDAKVTISVGSTYHRRYNGLQNGMQL